MLRLLLLQCSLICSLFAMAKTIVVRNINEINQANKAAMPGDSILFQNGEWNNINIEINCHGTKSAPIIFAAQQEGKVIITGKSSLHIGGSFLVIKGLYFLNGFSGKDAVITFRINKDEIASNCRVTNTVINDFNNPKRLDENYWIAFYGKNNRLDHCSIFNKKNMGVLLAVILDDDRSRKNFHSIDHNYFGVRLPLASNTGEIIRVGVSEHSEFNSNTNITDNYFEKCDGEAEIISIKSCGNNIRNNIFKECQGSVVLRHGNYNTVENNIFLGNNKPGTGGIRIINKGQWVVNNYFYKCRGVDFRSPLSIMNGVPNSPAYRYVAVSNALIANNSFYECSPISFCEGSDKERTEKPANTNFLHNIIYNSIDSIIYKNYDDISGIHFNGNIVNKNVQQLLPKGFNRSQVRFKNSSLLPIPFSTLQSNNTYPDTFSSNLPPRLEGKLSPKPGFCDINKLLANQSKRLLNSGAPWFQLKTTRSTKQPLTIDCATTNDIFKAIESKTSGELIIRLTGKEYYFNKPLNISKDVDITSSQNGMIKFLTTGLYPENYLLQIKAGNRLVLKNVQLDLSSLQTNQFISSDTAGSSHHYSFIMNRCRILNCKGIFFNAAKTSVSDSIVISNCTFKNSSKALFKLNEETEKKGYYSAELIKIINSSFSNINGQVVTLERPGKDESTLGPQFVFLKNKVNRCNTSDGEALIHLYGTQYSRIEHNNFEHSNPGKSLIEYQDEVRAVHLLQNNTLNNSGKFIKNDFVKSSSNIVQ